MLSKQEQMQGFIGKKHFPAIFLVVMIIFYSFLLFPDENIAYRIKIGIATSLFTLCLYSLNKWLFRLFLIILGTLTALYYPTVDFFGPLSASNVEAFMVTDYAEFTSYLSIIPFSLYLKAIFILILPIIFCFLPYRIWNKKTSLIILIAFIGLSFSKRYIISKFFYTQAFEGTANLIPVKVLLELNRFYSISMQGFKEQARLLKEKDDWQIDSTSVDKQLYFIIIGESVRNDVFSNPELYDPLPLDTIPKITFNHVISKAYLTVPSLKNAFVLKKNSDGPYFPDNVVNLAKKAGFHTEWLSNQGTVGEGENYVSAIAKCADYLEFLDKNNEEYKANMRINDTLLLNILRKRLKNADTFNHSIYFIHTIGSHASACQITGGTYDKFRLSDEVSCYIKTISNTKKLIYDIYRLAKNTGKSFKIVYFSDHGQTYKYKEKVLFHNEHTKQGYEVPMLLMADDLKNSYSINSNRNLGDFINFFQEFIGVRTKNASFDYRFVSEDPDKSWYKLEDGLNFNELENNPIPFNQK